MVKKGFLVSFLLCFILVVYTSHSLEISDSWYTHSDTIQIDGILYEISIDSQGETIFLRSESESLVHYVGRGSVLEIGDYELLFSSSREVTDEIDSSQKYYQANLVLNLLEPIVFTSIIQSKDGVYLGEEFEFDVLIQNNGTAPVAGVEFTYVYSDLFEIVRSSSCDYTNEKIFFTIDLDEMEDYSCSFRVIPSKPFFGEIVGETTYLTETQVRDFTSVSISVFEPLDVVVNLADESISMNNKSSIRLNFTQNATDDVDFRFVLYIPDFITQKDIPRAFDLIEEDNSIAGYDAYEVSQKFSDLESNDYLIPFEPTSSKDITFFYEYMYEYNDKEFVSDIVSLKLEVTDSFMDVDTQNYNYSELFNVTINISDDNQLYSLQKDDINIDFKNILRENISPVTAQVYIDDELHLVYNYSLITRLQRVRLPVYEYTAPFVSSDDEIDLVFHLSYTYNNTNYTLVKSEEISILTLPSITVKKSVQEDTIGVSESTIVSVSADYDGESRSIPYNFSEVIPDGFIINGVTQRTSSLIGADDELIIYNYEIVAKDVDNETTFDLLTTAFAQVEGYNQSFSINESVSVTVTPYKDGVSLSSQTPKSEVAVGEILPVDILIEQNGTTPIYNLTIYPIRGLDTDISYSPQSFTQLNPGDTREYEYEVRFTGDEPNISSHIQYSYYTPKGIYIQRNHTVFEHTLLVNNSDVFGPRGVIYANVTNYGTYNFTQLTASRSYTNLTLVSNGVHPISGSNTIINNTGSSMYATYSYLGRTFELLVPATITEYVVASDNSNNTLLNTSENETLNDTNADEIDDNNTSLSPVALLLIVLGTLIFFVLLAFIGREIWLKKSQRSFFGVSQKHSKSSTVKSLSTPTIKQSEHSDNFSLLKNRFAKLKENVHSQKKSLFMPKDKTPQKSKNVVTVSEQKSQDSNQIKKPEEKLSSLSLSEQLKQSRNLLNSLKK